MRVSLNTKSKELLEKIKNSDKEYIIGIDETGYGALAGEIYVCAFLAPKNWNHPGIDDSKALSKNTRKPLCAELIRLENVGYSIARIHPNEISAYEKYGTNVHGALKYAYWRAVNDVFEIKTQDYIDHIKSALIVLDGIIKFPEYPEYLADSISLPKADALIPQVSAASIIAKVHRDNYIEELSKKHPQYNWAENKGYPTPDHLAALKKYGYVDEHRKGYEPIKSMIKKGMNAIDAV